MCQPMADLNLAQGLVLAVVLVVFLLFLLLLMFCFGFCSCHDLIPAGTHLSTFAQARLEWHRFLSQAGHKLAAS